MTSSSGDDHTPMVATKISVEHEILFELVECAISHPNCHGIDLHLPILCWVGCLACPSRLASKVPYLT
jgi:hypothetical protein